MIGWELDECIPGDHPILPRLGALHPRTRAVAACLCEIMVSAQTNSFAQRPV